MFTRSVCGGVCRRSPVAVAIVVSTVALGACGSSASSSSSGASSASSTAAASAPATQSGGAAKGKTVYFLGCGPATPYCAIQNRQMAKQLAANGVKAVVENDGAYNVQIQSQQLSNAVAQHPALIAGVFTVQQPLRPYLIRAKAAGIPVLALDVPIAPGFSDLFAAHIGQNDFDEGRIAGQLMLEGLKQAGVSKGRLIDLSGGQGDQAALARENGFRAAARGSSYTVTVDYANWLPTQAATDTQQLLSKYSDVVGLFGANGSEAGASARAAIQAGKKVGGKGGIVITGGNCDPTAQQMISTGQIFGDDAQSPYTDVNTEVKTITAYLNGGPLPKQTATPDPVVTKANVSHYTKICTF
jgi:ABC-type sugar transport system substrate-binding protein